MLTGNACVVFVLLRSALGNVYTGAWFRSPVLGVKPDLGNVGAINAAGKTVPEGKLDEAAEAVYRVFVEARFVEDNSFTAVVFGEGEFLQQVGEHVGSADIVL